MAGGIRQNHDEELDQQSEINITPFIDVMLVLLIIFMVAAPLSTVDVPVNLPVATAKPQPRPEKPIFITLNRGLEFAVGERTIPAADLIHALDVVTTGKRDTRLFLRADKSVPYGAVLALLDRLRAAGYLKVGLVALENVGAGRPAEAERNAAPANPAESLDGVPR